MGITLTLASRDWAASKLALKEAVASYRTPWLRTVDIGSAPNCIRSSLIFQLTSILAS